MMVRATIILPTHGDRGPLLRHSIASVQRQTVQDFELFILGDGVSETSRACIEELLRADARLRFFDHPKDVRRGELNRHGALREARGEIVAYLCDRDLMMPDHLQILSEALQHSNFVHTLQTRAKPGGVVELWARYDLAKPSHVRAILRPETRISTGLSFVGHTLALYRQLPFGWRQTPTDLPTDHYMWKQFLGCPETRPRTLMIPTILYLGHGYFSGRGAGAYKTRKLEDWQEEMAFWAEQLQRENAVENLRAALLARFNSFSAQLWRAVATPFYLRPQLLETLKRSSEVHALLNWIQSRLVSLVGKEKR